MTETDRIAIDVYQTTINTRKKQLSLATAEGNTALICQCIGSINALEQIIDEIKNKQ